MYAIEDRMNSELRCKVEMVQGWVDRLEVHIMKSLNSLGLFDFVVVLATIVVVKVDLAKLFTAPPTKHPSLSTNRLK